MAHDVGAAWKAVRARVDAACARAGRNPADVTLVAVSKMHPAAAIRDAYAAGARDFGENYAQDLRDKARELADLPGIRWHFIGPLQANKAKYVAAAAHVFHALDREDVAAELGRRCVAAGRVLETFMEVNVAGEQSKHGVAPADVGALLSRVGGVAGLQVTGLMCIPPAHEDETGEASRPHFALLRGLCSAHGLSRMSMGMSGDYEVAIAEGATHVRVGTAIFGERAAKEA